MRYAHFAFFQNTHLRTFKTIAATKLGHTLNCWGWIDQSMACAVSFSSSRTALAWVAG